MMRSLVDHETREVGDFRESVKVDKYGAAPFLESAVPGEARAPCSFPVQAARNLKHLQYMSGIGHFGFSTGQTHYLHPPGRELAGGAPGWQSSHQVKYPTQS
jgi:hypothetical protein